MSRRDESEVVALRIHLKRVEAERDALMSPGIIEGMRRACLLRKDATADEVLAYLRGVAASYVEHTHGEEEGEQMLRIKLSHGYAQLTWPSRVTERDLVKLRKLIEIIQFDHDARLRRRVIVESPYAGDVERNLAYARACMHDCLTRGEAPFASHALYTQPGVLDDTIPAERKAGIQAGFEWRAVADATVVYTDLGISKGMEYGIEHASSRHPVEFRTLGGQWSTVAPTKENDDE